MTSCAFTRGESNSGRESDFGTTPGGEDTIVRARLRNGSLKKTQDFSNSTYHIHPTPLQDEKWTYSCSFPVIHDR